MSLDLKIIAGTVLDGSGRPGFTADIGISEGRIVEVGRVTAPARRELHADGALVTPGFVDVHTHYDGQASWDGDLRPSVDHGVTTAVLGSCGVGFAPVRPHDHERLIRLMQGVEDIPGTALAEGLTWKWESFPEYMDALDALPHAIDFAVQVPHDPLRVYVMGERAVSGSRATAEDAAEMARLTRQALEAGAVGFTTGRSDVHRTADGEWTPASEAEPGELEAIASAFRGLSHGVLQAVNDFELERDPAGFDREWEVMERFFAASGGRPGSLSLMQRDFAPNQWRRILEKAEAARGRGLTIRVQVAPRAIGVMVGLECTFHPFMGFPSYKRIAHLPLPERVRLMREPAFKARLLGEKSEPLAGDGSAIPPLADKFLAAPELAARKLFILDGTLDYEQPPERSLYAQAVAAGRHPIEFAYDTLLGDEGRALLYFPIYNYTEFTYANVLEMMSHPLALAGLSDAGAHVGTICDASFPTYLLQYWTRERVRGPRLELERAVAMLTSETARHVGLSDRGAIAPGLKADLNVIDLDRLGLEAPRIVRDLPAGGQRLLQEARGYVATIVSGRPVMENGVLTGERPGRLVRGGRAHSIQVA